MTFHGAPVSFSFCDTGQRLCADQEKTAWAFPLTNYSSLLNNLY